jgi:hypothetical protein
MGKYSDILDKREKETGSISIFPLENVWTIGREGVSSGYDKTYSLINKYMPDYVGQGARVVGSNAMKVINNIDRARGATAGVWDAIGEEGPKFYFNTQTGRYEWGDQDSVVDDQSFLSRAVEGAAEGWRDPFSKSFSDEITSLYPDSVKDFSPGGVPLGRAGEFITDVGFNIGGDPLTYTPARWIAAPLKGLGWLSEKSGISAGGRKVRDFGPIKQFLERFNVYTGDAANAQKLLNDLRLEARGADIHSLREGSELNEQLFDIAKDAGVSLPELKSAILEGIESGAIDDLARYGPRAITFAKGEIDFYENILAAEKAAGRNIEDIAARGVDPETGKIIGVGIGEKGYVPHIAQPTFTQKILHALSPNMPSEYRRTLEGTIKEINERAGRSFFMNDPVALRIMRQRWSNQVLAADRMLANAAENFGKRVSVKDGIRFDPNGVKIPDDWVTIKGHAYPADFARVLANQHKILSDPKKLNGLVRTFDDIQKWWKKYSLASRPAWHTRNAFGNFWNAYFLGGLTNAKRYGDAAAIQKAMHVGKGDIVGSVDDLVAGIRGRGVSKTSEVSGTGMTREEIFNEAVNRGVYETGLFAGELGGASVKASRMPGHTEWTGINKAFAAGKTMENNARLALFIDGIEKGIKKYSKGGKEIDPEIARRILDESATNVRKSLFDYSDLSQFEKDYMKRVIPFYTWTRKNIPAQLMAVIQHPDRANKLNILIGNMQKGVDSIDSNDVDQWVQDQFPIFLNAEDSENTHTFITALSYLPTAELNRVFKDPNEYLGDTWAMTSPLIKTPLEIWRNYDSFRKRPIDNLQWETAGTGWDLGEGAFRSVPGVKGSQSFLGMKVTPLQKHMLQSLVLLGEVDRLNPFGIFGQEDKKSWAGAYRQGQEIPESARWIRAVLGARIYERDKGVSQTRKTFDVIRQAEFLKDKVDEELRKGNRRNPELLQHLFQQLDAIIQGM